jgi:PQQ system protein
LGLIVVAVAGCGDDSNPATPVPAEPQPSGANASAQLVIHETEFKLDPRAARGSEAGFVTITIVNDGDVAHSLAVDGPNGLVELDGRVEPGATATLDVDLDKPGTYNMYCPLDGHRGKGMTGTIAVGGEAPARGAEPGTTITETAPSTTPTQTETQTRTQTQTETKTVTTPSPGTGTSTSPTATTGTPSGGGYGY